MTERRRSHWGWGWADRFPPEEGLRAIGGHVQSTLGFAPSTLRRPMDLDDVVVPPPRVTPPEALWSFCTTSGRDRLLHTYGRAWRDQVRGFLGDFGNAPDCVAHPKSENDLVELLAWASRERVAVVPYGGGTSVVGGVEHPRTSRFRGTVSVDMSHFDRVAEVDPVSRAARIEAGTLGPRIEETLARDGFTLRHYPQSFEFSTFGGWVATRAGGHFATVYTHIDDLIESVRMVTPAGLFETRRFPASGAGPSPERLVQGSEGALGIITEAWARIRPRPRWRATATVHFADFERAVDAVRIIAQSHLYPTNCRLLDPVEASLNGVCFDGSSVLIVAFESADVPVEHLLRFTLNIAADQGGKLPREPIYRDTEAGGDPTAGAWKAAFIDAPYLQSALIGLGVMVDTFETACTWSRFARVHAAIRHDVTEALTEVCGGGRLSCRFTHVYPDGPAPYYTFIAPVRPGSELSQWAEIKAAASEALFNRGATITHHHAVGRTHRPWYDRERPMLFGQALAAVKRTLDPAGVMNPGVLLDDVAAP
ncbi:FAD-binding oxidoreductase [Myxococcota bacterium]|nr:FAD-binding oxidoreductase [Myxococcota bacterium]